MLGFRQCFAEACKAMGRKPTVGDEYTNTYAFYDKPADGMEQIGGDVCVVMKEDGKCINMPAYAVTPDKEYIRSFDVTDVRKRSPLRIEWLPHIEANNSEICRTGRRY